MSDSNSSGCRTLSPWTVMGENFNIDENFKIVDYLGAGAYGVVCAAHDDDSNAYVAIKKCKKVFHSRTLAKRTLRELRLLRLMNHENVVKLISILLPSPSSADFNEIYVVFEIMETDLATIIKSPQPLNNQHIQYFMYQLLVALKYIHDLKIIHRDLKPRNLLVNSNCSLKIADFGLARVYNPQNDKKIAPMTEYVTTRWYRAPEILVGWPRYSSAVDIWAAGTILAELIGRRPIFPGGDSLKQLDLIVNIFGRPPESFIQMSRKPSHRHHLRDMHYNKPIQLSDMYPSANPSALNLLKQLLEIHPISRPGAEDALNHDYFKSLKMPPEKKPLMAYIPDSEFSYEEQENTIDDLRKEILREINYYHDSNGKDSGSDKSASTDYEKNIQTHNLTTVSSGVMHDFNEEKDDGNIDILSPKGRDSNLGNQIKASAQTSTVSKDTNRPVAIVKPGEVREVIESYKAFDSSKLKSNASFHKPTLTNHKCNREVKQRIQDTIHPPEIAPEPQLMSLLGDSGSLDKSAQILMLEEIKDGVDDYFNQDNSASTKNMSNTYETLSDDKKKVYKSKPVDCDSTNQQSSAEHMKTNNRSSNSWVDLWNELVGNRTRREKSSNFKEGLSYDDTHANIRRPPSKLNGSIPSSGSVATSTKIDKNAKAANSSPSYITPISNAKCNYYPTYHATLPGMRHNDESSYCGLNTRGVGSVCSNMENSNLRGGHEKYEEVSDRPQSDETKYFREELKEAQSDYESIVFPKVSESSFETYSSSENQEKPIKSSEQPNDLRTISKVSREDNKRASGGCGSKKGMCYAL